nr:MAG: hypothetical protein [Bacteriophage sp.]
MRGCIEGYPLPVLLAALTDGCRYLPLDLHRDLLGIHGDRDDPRDPRLIGRHGGNGLPKPAYIIRGKQIDGVDEFGPRADDLTRGIESFNLNLDERRD